MRRLSILVRGVVQGVGFRPFVHAAAEARGLTGWVRNRSDGVALEVEGPTDELEDFLSVLRTGPPGACVEAVERSSLPPTGERGFQILESSAAICAMPTLPADRATCGDCLAEITDARARRYRYPFTNCTRCGPRYTIVESLPYDRARTTMRAFPPCAACAAEHADPGDRRFHAEPIACPVCGPRLRLVRTDGAEEARDDAALVRAAESLHAGRIVAIKGLGGYHLLVDATSEAAVQRLRQRKHRPGKPFAVLLPSLHEVRRACLVDDGEAALLASPEAPILLLRRTTYGSAIASAVAPDNPYLGVLLPYTPLHRLLAEAVGRPLVCTSGNRSEEPLAFDDAEAHARLAAIADQLLMHDRDIARPVDDSVGRVDSDGLVLLRRARGFAPLPLPLAGPAGVTVLALGGQLKNTVTLAWDGRAVVSQHLGDLFSPDGAELCERTARELVHLFGVRPGVLACDLHPDYASTRLAERLAHEWAIPVERVQHHHAHVGACAAEHGLAEPLLGLAWDGAGLGPDGVIWGGEALLVDGAEALRVAHLRPFRLPGGERAMREPRRAALGLLHELVGADAAALVPGLDRSSADILVTVLQRRVNAPLTTSMGRLFDAVAALAELRGEPGFEGQAAMAVEFAAGGFVKEPAYPLPLVGNAPAIADWEPLVRALLDDRRRGLLPGQMAARFHAALVDLGAAIAELAGLPRVALSGGCFQNARLRAELTARLVARGFQVYAPRRYPTNDGGLSLGQAWVALRRAEGGADVPRHSR
jgi:hydrogenase maturation protein HypF